MAKWEEKRLSEVCSNIMYGHTESASFEVIGPKFLRITDIVPEYIDWKNVPYCKITDSEYQKYKLNKGDIVIARTGATSGYNKIILNDIKAVFASYLIKFSVNHTYYNARFVNYALKTRAYKGFIENYISGAAQPGINATTLGKFTFPTPDLPTQKRIADILSAYDDLIENNNSRIALLEKAAQDLYKEWFVRFRFPGYEKIEFENGIPEGWEVKRLGEVTEIGSSKRVYLSDYVQTGIPFYRSREIIQLSNGQKIDDSLFISNDAFNNFDKKFGSPAKHDILITSVGTIGISYMSDGHKFYFKDGNLTWLKTSQNPYLANYLFSWLNSETGKQSLLSSTIGTSQSALTIENLKRIKLIYPNHIILEEFSEKKQSYTELRNSLTTQNLNLKKQRDLLLPRLMSGKLEV